MKIPAMKHCAPLALLVALVPAPTLPAAEREVVELSPFIVSSAGDEGYRAANTLSGTRMNTSLLYTPASISVLTKEFLDDIGAENVLDMLKFAANTEHERSDPSGSISQAFDARATIRGFTESVFSRDYLPNMVDGRGILASDRFNVDRADVSRGPNSILFGAGRPGGALNLTSKRAILNGRQKTVTLTVGDFAKKRSEFDFALPLVKDKLALRANGVWEDREGWFEFEMARQKGLALAATYQPFKHTQIRAGMERMVRDQVLGGSFPQADYGYSRWVKNGSPLAGNPLLPFTNPAPTLIRSINTQQVIFAPQVRSQPFRMSTIGADVRPDLPGAQASGFWETVSGPNAPIGFVVDDPYYGQVIPANAYLGGSSRNANYKYTIYSLFLDQRIGGLNFEFGYNRTTYFRGFTPAQANAVGDPNPVLPGAYYADGDSSIAGGRPPGTLLPDIARANPFVGLPYVQYQAGLQQLDQRSESLRATVGYEFNLEQRHPWLGRHSVAVSWQHNYNLLGNGTMAEYNLAPGNTQLIDSATNIIFRRTYLDFWRPGGSRGALDPYAHPIPDGPGMKAAFIWNTEAPWGETKSTSGMLAGQSSFFHDRLVITAGYRRERINNNNASLGGERLPNSTNLWKVRSYLFDDRTAISHTGATKTLGAVVMPLPWLGFSYNQSESVFPQSSFVDLYQRLLTPSEGEGRDLALRLNLLGGRLYVNVTTYRNSGHNQFHDVVTNTTRTGIVPINTILTPLLQSGQPLPASLTAAGLRQLSTLKYRETVTSDGRGNEIEITGRLTPGWSVSLNYARPRIVLTDIAPDMKGFLAENKAAWDGNPTPLDTTPGNVATFVRTRDNTPGRDFVVNPATFNDAYDYVQSLIDIVDGGTGKPPLSFTGESFNAFTSYRFSDGAPALLRFARVGCGANYRGAPVIGYDAANANAPIFGRSSIIYNAMLGKQIRLRRGQSLDLQLNLENLFHQEDLVPFSAAAPGNVVRYMLPRVRHGWTVRATYTF